MVELACLKIRQQWIMHLMSELFWSVVYKKSFFKPKPEEDEKPLFKRIEMPEWLEWIVSTVLFFLVLWLAVYFLIAIGFIG